MRISDGRVRLAASDVANFLACRHLTRLDLLRARKVIEPPHMYDAGFEDLVKRGEAHEKEVLQGYRDRGLQVVEIKKDTSNPAAGAAATADAIASGVDVIYQAVLMRDGQPALLGFPDFLVRADLIPPPDGEPRPRPANDGPSYEVVDAKLARTAKGRAVAQTAFYSQLLADLQGGFAPRWLHLALGTGELVSYKVNDFAAYERQTRRLLTEFIDADTGSNPPADTYPEPVEHCAICRWSDSCAARRRSDDDLSLIAGITKGQRRGLKAEGIETRRGFAGLDRVPTPRGTSRESLERARSQAILQVRSEDAGDIAYELLEPDRNDKGELVPNRGLLALPEPVAGDLFFDIEGARYYSEDAREFGLQYLFGIVDTADVDAAGAPRYVSFWAFDRVGEKRAFEALIDFITERRRERPGLHVYHYNHYEPTAVDHLTELHETRQEAVGRLMGRFATREDEVDELFRLGVFVDLYRVVRQGLQAGVESYSIKRLEPLCGYSRVVRLRDATEALISFEAALDDRTAANLSPDAPEAELRQVVAGYNEDDCRATLALRDWLESLRPELAAKTGAVVPRPAVPEAEPDAEDSEVTRLREALMASVPAQPSSRTPEESARALLADLLEWHRRENKPQWWRYFYVRTLSPEDLVAEPDALGLLTGGAVVGEVKKSVLRRFSFPPQEHKFDAGETAHDLITDRGFEVYSVDDARGEIVLKVGAAYEGPWPTALVQGGPPQTKVQAERMRNLGARVLDEGLSGLDAATALLLRQHPLGPAATGRPLRLPGETAPDAAIRLALSLANSYMPIQGPPGTGKTYSGADQILELIGQGRKVGITANSHAVICNFIDEVFKHAAASNLAAPKVGQKAEKDNPLLNPDTDLLEYPKLVDGLANGDLNIAGGTTWMWSRPEFQGSVDTLFVDEAGQMSLANVLSVAGAARNVILLGDPQQLAQPSQAAHPPGSGASALEHILGPDHVTMPPEAGLLIDKTYRMHPDLCRFTSETFYDGKLTGVVGLELQEILGNPPASGAGLRVIEVPHEGNTNASSEEAAVVADLVRSLLGRQWRNSSDELAPIGVEQIMVVTPYNAQIRAIQSAAATANLPCLLVGTVDKFQGRQAPVVIYSMATSSADDAPRGMEFLYDLHRLNVATSRAKALAIIVASPDLVRVACQTPRQMHLANALCHAWESGK